MYIHCTCTVHVHGYMYMYVKIRSMISPHSSLPVAPEPRPLGRGMLMKQILQQRQQQQGAYPSQDAPVKPVTAPTIAMAGLTVRESQQPVTSHSPSSPSSPPSPPTPLSSPLAVSSRPMKQGTSGQRFGNPHYYNLHVHVHVHVVTAPKL